MEQEKPERWLKTVLLTDEPGHPSTKSQMKEFEYWKPTPFWPPLPPIPVPLWLSNLAYDLMHPHERIYIK